MARAARRNERITDYVRPREKLRACQAMVSARLFDQVNGLRKREGFKWRELLEACFETLLAEIRGKR